MLLHDSGALPDSTRLAISSFSKSRIAAAGIDSQIAEALPLVAEAFRGGPGPFALQAAIAAVHCQAARAEDTDWPQILRLYDLLDQLQPSPIVSLNRAVAVAMVGRTSGGASAHRCAHRNRRSGRVSLAACGAWRTAAANRIWAAAAKSYAVALELVSNSSERRFLERRLREVQAPEA